MRNQIHKVVRKAFDALQDLTTLAEFSKKKTAFDFATGETVDTLSTTKVIKVLLLSTTRKGKEKNIVNLELLLKKADIVDISQYDTLKVDNLVYKISDEITDDGYLLNLNAVRGVPNG